MQLVEPVRAQDLHRLHADLQMLVDLPAIERVGHARQFQLAVQRLVRYAQQRAVRHPEAEAVGCDRRAFHVERDRAALRQPLHGLAMVAQFPVAVVDARDRARTHHPLQFRALQPRDLGHAALERELHFGQRRNRHPQRQVGVEHVIFPHVTVREHVVAEALRVAQPRAVTEHHPSVRTQHRDVIGDRLRVRRADADVDHRDPAAVRALQVIRGHLRQARRRGALGRLAAEVRVVRDDVARLDERAVLAAVRAHLGIVAFGHQRAAELHELVDVELVVRVEHVVLEMRGRRRRVVTQPVQREVDAGRREQRERMRLARRRLERAVDDAVIEIRQVGRVEDVAHREQAVAIEFALEMDAFRKREMDRNRLRRHADLDLDMVVLRQQTQLLAVVVREEIGARDGRLEYAGTRDEAVRAARIDVRVDVGPDPHERVARAHVLGNRFVAAIARERIAQEARIRVVNGGQPRDGGDRIVESLDRRAFGRQHTVPAAQIVFHFHHLVRSDDITTEPGRPYGRPCARRGRMARSIC